MADNQEQLYQAQKLIRQARSCIMREDFASAEILYIAALGIQKQALGYKHADVARTLLTIGLMFRKQKRYIEARNYCQQSLSIRKELLGSDHADTLENLRIMASLHRDEKQYTEAEQIYHEVLRCNKDREYAEIIANDIARLHLDSKRYADAEDLLKSILSNPCVPQ